MPASHLPGASRRALTLASVTCALVLGVPLAALAEWSQFQGDASHQGVSEGPSAPLQVVWSIDDIEIEDADITGGLSPPVVAEDGTIVSVGPNEVLAFDPDGSEVFSADRDLGLAVQPAIAQGSEGPIVVFTEGFGEGGPPTTASPAVSPSPADDEGDEVDSHVNAVDLRTGETVWASPVPLEDLVRTPVAADETAAYVGDVGGRVTAVELSTGEIRWAADVGASIAGAVTPVGDLAYVSTVGEQRTPGAVIALDVSTGDEVWRSSDEAVVNDVVSAPVLADDRLIVLEPGHLVALDAADGGLLWRTEVVNPLTTPFASQGFTSPAPVATEGRVLAVDVTGRVYAFDAASGTELWDHAIDDASLSPPVLTGDHVLLPMNSGVLYAVDRTTGHLAFRVDSRGPFLRGLADAGDVLVGVTGIEDARIVAFGPDPDASLTDEPSPTAVDVVELLGGFALGALPAAIAALALARPLHRRLRPVPEPGSGEEPR